MTKFRCIKGNSDIPVGTIIEGELEEKYIRLTEDSAVKDGNNNHFFMKGETVLLTGYVWQWESCADMKKLLERFEDTVDVLATYERDILEYGESDIDHSKAELLKRLS